VCDAPLVAVRMLNTTPGVLEVALYGLAIHALVDPQAQSEGQLSAELERAGVHVRQVTEIEPTLEDVFISLIAQH
jgi:drug efflux transport system ATP-binding protein